MNKLALKFYQEIIKLNEKEKEDFKRIVRKLLKVNYIVKQKKSNSLEYDFITDNIEVFKAYFAFMDFDIILNTDLQLVVLHNKKENNNLKLRLNESLLLLILRLLYEKKSKEMSANKTVIITLHDLFEEFIQTGLKDRKINKTELRHILMLFHRFNLIEIIDHNYNDHNSRIILYPTLLYAVNINDINLLYEKILSYNK